MISGNEVAALRSAAQDAVARGDHATALLHLQKAAALAPKQADIQFDLGRVLLALEQYVDAELILRTLARAQRDSPEPRLALAYALVKQRRHAEAIAELHKLLERFPAHAEGWFNLGNVHRTLGRFSDAARCFRRAASLQPANPDPQLNLAIALAQDEQIEEARAALRDFLAVHPHHAEALNNLGQIERAAGRSAAAMAAFDAALAAEPNHTGVQLNRAIVHAELGHRSEARSLTEALLDRTPHDASAQLFLATLDLGDGVFATGWKRYGARSGRQRWLAQGGAAANTTVPTLDSLTGKTVALCGEQGLGDVLFFLRFAPLLANVAAQVVLDLDPRLEALLSGHPFASAVRSDRADIALLVGDLPAMVDAVPPPLPLTPDSARMQTCAQTLSAAGPRPYIGVTWEAGTRWSLQQEPGVALFKRIEPAALGAALAGIPGTFVSLQRSPRPDDVAAFVNALGRHVVDLSGVNNDLRDALAVLSLLDDYVGVSNTNMHLRASARRAARVLVTLPAEWRWMNAGDVSPWFPGFTLYRQTVRGWDTALESLVRDLRARAASPSAI